MMVVVVVRNYLLLHPLSLCPQAFAAPTVLPHHHHLRLLRCPQPHLSLLQSHTLVCMHVKVNMHAMTCMHIHDTHAQSGYIISGLKCLHGFKLAVSVHIFFFYTLEVNILKGIYTMQHYSISLFKDMEHTWFTAGSRSQALSDFICLSNAASIILILFFLVLLHHIGCHLLALKLYTLLLHNSMHLRRINRTEHI